MASLRHKNLGSWSTFGDPTDYAFTVISCFKCCFCSVKLHRLKWECSKYPVIRK